MSDIWYTYDFNILRPSGSNIGGVYTKTFTTSSSNVKGYLEPLSGNERYFNDKKEAYTTNRLFSDVIDVTEKDTIEISGNRYDIDSIGNQDNDHLEIILIRRN